MTSIWHRFTRRGKGLVCLSAIGLIAAFLTQSMAIYRISAFILALCIISLAIASVPLKGLHHQRRVPADALPAGSCLDISLTISGDQRTYGRLLHCEEVVPYGSGRRPRFGISSPLRSWTHDVSYQIVAAVRGRHRVGPLLVRSFDPLGIARHDMAFTATSTVKVLPTIVDLTSTDHYGHTYGNNSSSPHLGRQSSDDVLIRPYQRGDERRRLHWKATAKTGELMVRREEESPRCGLRILIDNRYEAHRGYGTADSFEWAMTLLASLCHLPMSAQSTIAIGDAWGQISRFEPTAADRDSLMIDYLIDMHKVEMISLSTACQALSHHGRADSCYAIIGLSRQEDIYALADMRGNSDQATAFVIDALSFDETPTENDFLSADESAAILEEGGWNAVIVTAHTSVASAWSSQYSRGSR